MPQLTRYLVIGSVNNISMYLLYLIALQIGMGPKAAMSACYLIGATIGFIGNKAWTFKNKESPKKSIPRFVAAHAMAYSLNIALLATLIDKLNIDPAIAQGIAIPTIACTLFLLFKFFVFKNSTQITNKTGIFKNE